MKNKFETLDITIKNMLDQTADLWACKETNTLTFIDCNSTWGRMVGFNKSEDAKGVTAFDIPSQLANCAELFEQQEKTIMKTNQMMQILDIHPMANDEWHAYLTQKIPLFDDNQQLIGVAISAKDITTPNVLDLGSVLSKLSTSHHSPKQLTSQNSYLLNHKFHDIVLNDHEAETLFYLLRGKSIQQISVFLSMTYKKISEIIHQLNIRFHAKNKSELIDKAIENGFLTIIPPTLLRKQLSIELKTE